MKHKVIGRIIGILILIALAFIMFGCGDGVATVDDECKQTQKVHAWGTLAWPIESYNLRVKNNAESRAWDDSLTLAIEDWNNMGSSLYLEEVSNDEYDIQIIDKESDDWLGLAEIWTNPETDYIHRARVSMSNSLLSGYTNEAIRHVMCQEIGHALSLGHITGNTCMDNCSSHAPKSGSWFQCLDATNKVAPNKHDAEQLIMLYGEAANKCR